MNHVTIKSFGSVLLVYVKKRKIGRMISF